MSLIMSRLQLGRGGIIYVVVSVRLLGFYFRGPKLVRFLEKNQLNLRIRDDRTEFLQTRPTVSNKAFQYEQKYYSMLQRCSMKMCLGNLGDLGFGPLFPF